MGLIQFLLTEGKKDIIIEKIGLPEHLAEHCMRYYDKKFVLYWASAIKNAIMDFDLGSKIKESDYPYERFESVSQFEKFKELEEFIKNPNLPQIPKEVLNEFKETKNTPFKHFQRADELLEMYTSIRDYANATNQNFQNDDFDEVYQDSVQWHEEKEATGQTIQVEGDAEVIHTFNNGYYWVDNHDSDCKIEGDAMGHCGSTRADTILSLRSPKGEPHISVAFDYDGTYTQAKGKGNNKPAEKYHRYMEWLFTNGGDYQIKKYRPEYQKESDYTIEDLPENIREDVLNKYPSIDPHHHLKSIINNDSLSDKQKFDEIVKLDVETDMFYGEFAELYFDEEKDMVLLSENVDPIDYAKNDDPVLTWSINMLRYEDYLDISGVDSSYYIDLLDTNKFPYDSDKVQYLISLAEDEDKGLFISQVQEFADKELMDVPLEEYLKDGDHLISFLEFLYDSNVFDEFNTALDRVTRWSMETTAYDEIYKDTIDFIISTPMITSGNEEIYVEWDYKLRHHLVSTEGDPVDIMTTLHDIVEVIMEEDYELTSVVDLITPYEFIEEMNQPQYGYPKGGIKKEVFNDHFEDGVYN